MLQLLKWRVKHELTVQLSSLFVSRTNRDIMVCELCPKLTYPFPFEEMSATNQYSQV